MLHLVLLCQGWPSERTDCSSSRTQWHQHQGPSTTSVQREKRVTLPTWTGPEGRGDHKGSTSVLGGSCSWDVPDGSHLVDHERTHLWLPKRDGFLPPIVLPRLLYRVYESSLGTRLSVTVAVNLLVPWTGRSTDDRTSTGTTSTEDLCVVCALDKNYIPSVFPLGKRTLSRTGTWGLGGIRPSGVFRRTPSTMAEREEVEVVDVLVVGVRVNERWGVSKVVKG